MSTLRLDGVSKHFDGTLAVDEVSFELGEHELLALVGPSGCGKSTLLRMIAGLQPSESGSIESNGRIVDDGRTTLPPEDRHIGLVFQEHALFPHLTVSGNIGFGVRDGTRAARVDEMLALVGLDRYGARYPHELSGGERQRVALARALAPKPSLLLLDEPFASLDPNLRARVRDDVAAILRATGTPAVFVTHDQGEALAVGDRVAVMRAGRIVQIDRPDVVFHRPVDRFVASFMGEADFVDADALVTDVEGVQLDVADVGDLRDVLMMVRPDDVTFAVSDSGGSHVAAAEFRGSSWCYTLALPSGATVRSTRSHLDRIDVGARVVTRMQPGHRPVPLPID